LAILSSNDLLGAARSDQCIERQASIHENCTHFALAQFEVSKPGEGKRGERIYGERKAVGELNEVIRFVKNYRGAGRSEQIFSTNPLIYFLTSRQNATSCDYIIIGNVGSGFENEAMEAIKSGKPCLVILDGELRNYQLFCSWGNIENCIFKHYKIALASSGGRYLILERRNEFAREIRKLEGLLADENVDFKVIRNYDPDNKRGRITLSGDARDAVILSKERPRVEFPLEISSGSGILFAVGPSAEDVKALKVALGNSDVFSVTSKPEETWQFYIHKYKGKLPFHGKPYEITCSIELLDPKEGDYVAVAMPSILSPRKNGDFNVVVFSCDALRADHLNLYGYPRNTAPNLARLAESSWTFSNAISQSSWTAPSFASVLTSTYPSENGVYRERYSDRLDALDYGWWDPSTWEVINLDCVENDYGSSLPEVLRRNGYFTKAYTFIELFSDYAVNQSFGGGFDSLEMAHQLDSGRYGKAITTQMCFDRVKSFLQDYANYKFCLFFHVKEPHTDYAPPESFARKFIDPSYKGPIGLRIGQWKVFSETYTDDDNRRIVDLYDAQINYADDILGQLIETLKSLGIYENTLLVFMSDHGEEFASDPIDAHKGRYVHGHSLRYHLIHVPLVIHLPGLSAGTKRELVQLLDVAPTLYDFLGIHVNPEHITGKSLLPLISGKTDKFRGYAISERVCYGTEKQSILEDGYQYIRTLGVPYEELYSLNPSDSNVNLAEYLPQQVAERRARLDAILNVETDKKSKGTDAKADKSKRPAEATSRTLTQRAVENLKSLGYLK
jgi:arylsulfatase A-like enzyme